MSKSKYAPVSEPTPSPSAQQGHTPGPWTVKRDRRAKHSMMIKAGAQAIAKVNEFVREAEANAALLADAPRLLTENAALAGKLAAIRAEAELWLSTASVGELRQTLRNIIALSHANPEPKP